MKKFLLCFRHDDSGAVTVDWVVLTAMTIALAIAAFASIETNSATMVGEVVDLIQAEDPTGSDLTIGSSGS